jgi:CheY-like chemotaxis protein
VETKEGEGAEFYYYITDSITNFLNPVKSFDKMPTIMKILVVDDERDIEVLFEQRFRREIKTGEIDFAFAYSGEQALQYLNQHVHEAVLILSDINMPGMSGP